MSRAVALVSAAAFRRLAAASRPLIATRAASSSPAVVARPVLLFRPGPVSFFPRDQSRGYARRRVRSDSESEYSDDSDEDDVNTTIHRVIAISDISDRSVSEELPDRVQRKMICVCGPSDVPIIEREPSEIIEELAS